MYNPNFSKKVLTHGIPSTVNLKHLNPNVPIKNIKQSPPEVNLPHFVNYYADLAGCGFWRIKWPEYLLNINNKAAVTSLAQMVFDGNWYKNIKTIKFQRQATTIQKRFLEDLVKLKKEFKYNLLYEIDDVVFGQDIPNYNHQKRAFTDPEINSNILSMMQSVDEITVTTPTLKEYYKEKTNHSKITIIPNYIPKFWAGRLYDNSHITSSFDKNKKRPRILYAGSATHIKPPSINSNEPDDFSHVIESIIRARKDFKFVFKGAYPYQLKPYIEAGEIEYHGWSPLLKLPTDLLDLNCNAVIAPLANNTFNKCKSNIKMLEAGALGLPGAYQDLDPYKDAPLKFQTGEELIDQLKLITKSHGNYIKHSQNSYKIASSMWLEDHISEHFDVYNSSWGSAERNKNLELIKNNLDQKI